MPPVIARTYFSDSLKISGARMNRAAVKTRITQRNPEGRDHEPRQQPLGHEEPHGVGRDLDDGLGDQPKHGIPLVAHPSRAPYCWQVAPAARQPGGPTAMIRNPILKGFNPDPSICRAENDYYIATSTFEWFPGVQIHHSRDLVNWRLVARPLTRAAQLGHARQPRQLRRLGPLPLLGRRPLLADLHRRQAPRRLTSRTRTTTWPPLPRSPAPGRTGFT